jgi:hypothetical protein
MWNSALRFCFSTVLILLLSRSALVVAQELSCTGLNPDAGPLGYRERSGDARCEGFYRSPVAGVGLELFSLTAGTIDFQLRPTGTLYISAPDTTPLKAAKFRIQARALPLSTYYRMDAIMESGTTFKWPMSSLHPAKLTSELIGVAGWIDEGATTTYIPLAVSDGGPSSGNTVPLVAILRSTLDLEKLFWRRWPEGRNGEATSWESAGSAYRAGQAIRLEYKPSKGVTVLSLSAKTVGSDDWASIELKVYQP